MNFSLHYSINYFKNDNGFPSILNLFRLMHLFRNDFQRYVQDPVQMPDITKRNSNAHFILGNTGHALRGLTVNVTKNWFYIKCVTRLQTKTQI